MGLKDRSTLYNILCAGMIVLALLVRLDDLDDPPLDFHPTRQLWSALIARGMYYHDLANISEWKRQIAEIQWKGKDILEPRVIETLAAAGYRLLGEDALWLPRLYSSLFWVLGAIPLYLLARDLSNLEGGLFAAAFYLFLPYGVIASRSFQPEPLVVSCMVFALWALHRWSQAPTAGRTLLAGCLACLAIYLKASVLFPLLGGMLGLFVSSRGIKRSLRDAQVWSIVFLALVPNLVYFVYGAYIDRFLALSLNGRFFPELLMDPWFYIRWELKINQVMGHVFLALALLGLFFFRSRPARWMVAGLWIGYAATGMIVNYQTSTHDYYHLPLIPVAALSLSVLAGRGAAYVKSRDRAGRVAPLVLAGILLSLISAAAWHTHITLHRVDYRGLAANYERIGKRLGHRHKVIALTEDYGYRLAYWGWLDARVWPSYGDLKYREKLGGKDSGFEKTFDRLTSGMGFFLVTWFDEFTYQPELKAYLSENFPIYDQGEGYVVYELKRP